MTWCGNSRQTLSDSLSINNSGPPQGRATELRSQVSILANLHTDLLVGLHRYFSNPSKPRRTLISRVLKGSKTLRPRTGTRHTTDSRGPVRENSSQSQTRLSASNRVALLAGYAEGVPVQELATRFNVHRATVREIARRAGHPSRSPEHSQQLRSEAARLYAEGFTLSQVAAQLGIGDEAVRSAVVANGGTIRPKGRRRMNA